LTLADLSTIGLVLPPPSNPMRLEVEAAAAARGITLDVVVEVEGIRLIADLVAAGAGASVLPLTAVPPELTELRVVAIADAPARLLALVNAPDAYLSLADQAVRVSLRELVTDERRRPGRPVDGAGALPPSATAVTVLSEHRATAGGAGSMSADNNIGKSRRFGPGEVIVVVLLAIVAVFAIANFDDTRVDFVVDDVTLPLVAVIVASLVIGFIVGWVMGVRDND
jgi:uncharacterized integral membrane protein